MTEGPALPSGTVTFLFTDIEGSTETVDLLGDERYADLLAEHHRLLRRAFVAHRGHEVDTEGDAFFVAFAGANDAIVAAIDAQRAIESFDWPGEARLRVRIGLHTGEALVREGNYVGHDVHKAKRICDAGHGGQVLLSQTTADLVSKTVTLVDLGPHRLKDLGEPQHIYQIVDEHLQRDFAPLRSLETFRHNLPAQRTSFVGRSSELDQLRGMLEHERLVTLTGVGGVGKTRLAIQAGAELLDDYDDGVYFVDLAPLAEPDAIAQAIANVLGLSIAAEIGAAPPGPTDERMIAHLATRTCLVILDNCEHLLDPCAELADRLLAACPDLTILATSREALDVDGEQSWRLPSLSLPETDNAQDSEAVSLFKTRAKTVRPDFELTPANIEVVAEICRRLDGIPLAIELAASRISHLTPEEIATRLEDMFQLLAGGRRRRVQRQQTLQAALDWSYDLLGDSERILLRRLAVFAGPFTLEAAEGICAVDDIEPRRVLDLLGSLVAKSLVGAEAQLGTTRYRLMETVRQYAGEKLREADEADRYRVRHRDWYLTQLTSQRLGTSAVGVAGELLADYPNYAAALERSYDEGRLDLVVRMATRLMMVWAGFGHLETGYRWLSLARPEDLDITIEERVAALEMLSYLANVLQLPTSLEYADRAIEAAHGEPFVQLVRAYGQRAFVKAIRSRVTGDLDLAEAARRDHADAERVAEQVGARRNTIEPWRGNEGMSRLVLEQGIMLELILGDYEAAFAPIAHLDPGDLPTLSSAAIAAHLVGAHEVAAAIGWERFETFVARKASGAATDMFVGPAALSPAAIAGAGEIDGARRVLAETIDANIARGMPQGIEMSATVGAVVAYLDGAHADASRLLSWVRARVFDQGQILLSPAAYALYKHYVPLVRDALAPDDARRYRDEGRSMSEEQAIATALRTDVA